jgi:hypothetical protein
MTLGCNLSQICIGKAFRHTEDVEDIAERQLMVVEILSHPLMRSARDDTLCVILHTSHTRLHATALRFLPSARCHVRDKDIATNLGFMGATVLACIVYDLTTMFLRRSL